MNNFKYIKSLRLKTLARTLYKGNGQISIKVEHEHKSFERTLETFEGGIVDLWEILKTAIIQLFSRIHFKCIYINVNFMQTLCRIDWIRFYI